MNLEEQVRRTVLEHELIQPDDSVVLAVSGGVDSMVLLDLLHRLAPVLGCSLTVATFNHRWRPEAAGEVALVAAEAARRGLDCRTGQAFEQDRSEAGARRQRRAFLESVATELGAAAIATGHHRDDRIETLLLNLLRGAGTTGLGALGPRQGLYIRPLLELSRREVEAYAAARQLPCTDDASNRDPRWLRNRVRHELRPLLDQLRPGAEDLLLRSSIVLGHEREALESYGARLLAEVSVASRPERYLGGMTHCRLGGCMRKRPVGERWLIYRAALASLLGHLTDVDLAIIGRLDDLLLGPADRGPVGQGSWQAWRAGDDLLLLPAPLELHWSPVPWTFDQRVKVGRGIVLLGGAEAGDAPLRAGLRRPTAPAEVRPWRPGDRYRPTGRGGSRKVSDLLLEMGVPRPVRARVPVVCVGDELVWLPGLPPAEGWGGTTPVGLAFEDP